MLTCSYFPRGTLTTVQCLTSIKAASWRQTGPSIDVRNLSFDPGAIYKMLFLFVVSVTFFLPVLAGENFFLSSVDWELWSGYQENPSVCSQSNKDCRGGRGLCVWSTEAEDCVCAAAAAVSRAKSTQARSTVLTAASDRDSLPAGTAQDYKRRNNSKLKTFTHQEPPKALVDQEETWSAGCKQLTSSSSSRTQCQSFKCFPRRSWGKLKCSKLNQESCVCLVCTYVYLKSSC